MKNKRFKESVSDISGEGYKTCKEDCGTGTERLFTQRELERCIGERLTRERRKAAPLEKLKEVLERLMEGGVIDADSYAEAAEVLCKKLEQPLEIAGNTGEDGSEGVASGISDTDCAAEAVQEAASKSEVYEYTPKKQDAGDFEAQYADLCRRYPYVDGEALMADNGFKAFCRGRGGSLTELYEDFAELMRELGSANAAAVTGRGDGEDAYGGRHSVRTFSSTAFSAGSASPAFDAGAGLSSLQRDIARRAGISYREYAQMLRDIPKTGKAKRTSDAFSMR